MSPLTPFLLALVGIGVASLVFGLRTPLAHYRFLAPTGVMGIVTASSHLLRGIVPDVLLMSLLAVGMGGAVYWLVQLDKQEKRRDADSR
jgi:hypothetical protein